MIHEVAFFKHIAILLVPISKLGLKLFFALTFPTVIYTTDNCEHKNASKTLHWERARLSHRINIPLESNTVQRFDLYSKHNIYIDRYGSQQDDENY